MKKILTVFLLCLFLAGCRAPLKEYTAAATHMGTVTTQHIYTDKEDITPKVDALLSDLEKKELSKREEGSEIFRINSGAGDGEGFLFSEPLRQEIRKLLEICDETDGAFDISVGALTALWDLDTLSVLYANGEDISFLLPTPDKVNAALQNTGYRKIVLQDEKLFLPSGMSLDLGAAGKGIACDRIYALLEEEGVSAAVIAVGGSVLTYGQKPGNASWQIAVTDPFGEKEYAGMLSVTGTAFISTSGDYERFIEADGIRYFHILDPQTGYPAKGEIRSVTILCDCGILSDALSTACFVLGEEKGLALAEKYGAQALFIRKDGSFCMTEGMKKIFTPYQ